MCSCGIVENCRKVYPLNRLQIRAFFVILGLETQKKRKVGTHMDMPKLLIADSDDEFRQSLCNVLKDRCSLRSCSTGQQALELLRSFRPDVLILDLMLPELDGITLLNHAHQAGILPAVMTLSAFQSGYIASSLQKLGIHYMMSKPCNLAAIADHIQDMTADLIPAPAPVFDVDSAIADLLLSIGYSTKHDGYWYLISAIPIFAADMNQCVTKHLYPAVAKPLGRNPQQIERSIRNATNIAWRKQDCKARQQYFPTAPDGSVPRPTNKVLVSHLADALNRQLHSWRSA